MHVDCLRKESMCSIGLKIACRMREEGIMWSRDKKLHVEYIRNKFVCIIDVNIGYKMCCT